MKLMSWIAVVLASVSVTASAAALARFETADIEAIFPHIDRTTLVIFDIDSSLIQTTHMLGGEAWADMMVRRYTLEGMTPLQARAELTPLWNAILVQSVVGPVDPSVQMALRSLQRQGIRVMGMTDKDPEMAYVRLDHLRVCDADLALTAPYRGILNVRAEAGTKMVHGVLFTGVYNNPGEVLVTLLNQIGYYPSKVIMVSNKAALLHEVERSLSHLGVPFVPCRLSLADAQLKAYRPEIADIQLNLFNRVMSDEAARALQPQGTGFWPF
jgi:Protein of unknown function (DUF2608)